MFLGLSERLGGATAAMSARRQESLVRAPKSPVKLGYFCGKPYQDEVKICPGMELSSYFCQIWNLYRR